MTGAELGDLLFDGPASGLWPILLLPWLAHAIGNRAARTLPPTRADWRVAAALAGLPGLVMATLAASAITRGLSHPHLDGTGHLAKYHLPMIVAAAVVGRAAWRAAARHHELRRIRRLAAPPSGRLAGLAREVGVEVRQLPVPDFECFVTGAARPMVLVSTGTIERMNDGELRALLYHEKAHVRGRDTAVLLALSLLDDCFSAPGAALEAYRQSRERHADAEAVKAGGPLTIASALLKARKLPRPGDASGGAWCANAFENEAWRLHAILSPQDAGQIGPRRRAVAGLAAQGLLVCWPAFHITFAYLLCS